MAMKLVVLLLAMVEVVEVRRCEGEELEPTTFCRWVTSCLEKKKNKKDYPPR